MKLVSTMMAGLLFAGAISLGAGAVKQNKNDSKETDKKKPSNILWILLDDISTERFPESGNQALKGMLPGFDELKDDGAVYYPHFYAPSSYCAPAQVALFSGMEPGDIGGQYQFSTDIVPGKATYATVPPPEVMFAPEKFRSLGYWSTAAGKLDYQVGEVMPTFYNEITGGLLVDTLQPSVLSRIWEPAMEQDRPFYGMLNMMDTHQLITAMQREAPIPLTDPATGSPPQDLPFKHFGYTVPQALLFNTGVDGTAQRGTLTLQDLDEVDIVGYAGDYNISMLSHANGGVPGYLPEDDGIKSILANEYDAVRNDVDYRLQKIIGKLKSDGLYDDTLILVFGDHGSATFKGKVLLQPQSVRTPLWIKYPKKMKLSEAVHKNEDLHNVDSRMTHITDLYPTSLSVIGEKPEAYMTGRALAGKFEDTSPPREMMFSLIARVGSRQAWKSFAAYTKNSF
jgi:N-sulfoglucosamine sulfohydrolase